ncbi:peroxidase family protein [Frondihabitans australicus]|uniref:Heme peroxidase n=1 Tax=Frondihabitans australicus TaxID=386892 RepID=A0A495IFZ2_9MICO|nr:heme peroxidase family protein [Frondihabitans australicus]RKR74917.1 heme peroxidase [Frondihabitans australicus]
MTASHSTSANPAGGHGGGVRGDLVAHRSSQFEGRYGRLFRSLPAASWPMSALNALGHAMTADPETDPADPTMPAASPETDAILQDDEENAGIPAGYTYFGQFIDHDITFDPASSMMKANDPDALIDFRTPRLDLDNVYGRGPDDQPYLYVGNKLRLGRHLTEGVGSATPGRGHAVNLRDVPRYADVDDPTLPKRALIGDKRNDENVIVSQLQSSILQFHNRLVDLHPTSTFAEVQQLVRWHYQWLVINDFLVRICGKDLVDEIFPHRLDSVPAAEKRPTLSLYRFKNDPFMPIEFSVAAYRFGHSMVRPIYRLNTVLDGGDDPLHATAHEKAIGLAGRFFIFAGVQIRGLDGFDEFPSPWAIDWSLFFDIPGVAPVGGKRRVQPAYKIDTSLVNPLGFLPEFSTLLKPPVSPPITVEKLQAKPVDPTNDPANLAIRNLLRGMALQLPSGQAVADALGIDRIPDDQLTVQKATLADTAASPQKLVDLDTSFAGNAPLWYYVLAEAQVEWLKKAKGVNGKGDAEPLHLGPVGGRIVAETLIGLIQGDSESYLNQRPNFEPVVDGKRLDTVGALLQWAVRS